MARHSFTALNSAFVVDAQYRMVKELGQGAYGCVIAAVHSSTGEGCAIKKITNINTKVSDLRRDVLVLIVTRRAAYPHKAMLARNQVRAPSNGNKYHN